MNNSESYRLECEIKEWRRQIAEKGRRWWHTVQIPRLIKKRGKASVDRLREAMNK